MNRFLFIVIASLQISFLLRAETDVYINFGYNISSLRQENSENISANCLGMGFEYFEPNEVLLGLDIMFVTKCVRLKNKTWPGGSYAYPPNFNYRIGTIENDFKFLELSFKIGSAYLFANKKLSTKIFAGPLFSIPIKAEYDGQAWTKSLPPDELGKFDYDYLIRENGRLNTSLSIFAGFIISYKSVGLGARYLRALGKTNLSRGLAIEDMIDSYQIIFHYTF